ncbi:hypothetical protein BJ741DRAFT_630158 [Chytriomyces cf. hyalinus JEL632]|nr:hypothetical protein BJ741DRAFT_630158 [Chytriomyces cf. hyalinus JEL632]
MATLLLVALAASLVTIAAPFLLELNALYSWHPLAMSVYMGLSIAGVLSLQRLPSQPAISAGTGTVGTGGSLRVAESASSRRTSLAKHALLQLVAMLSYNIGFCAIYIDREYKNKHHFKNWHARLGLFAYILTMILLPMGVAMQYFPQYSFGSLVAARKWGVLKRVLGNTALLVSVIVMCLGMQMHSVHDRVHVVGRWFAFLGLLGVSCAAFWNVWTALARLVTGEKPEPDSKELGDYTAVLVGVTSI